MKDDTMIAHDPNKPLTKGWHLDKRISLAHIMTTVSLLFGLGSVIWAIESRVTVVEQRVSTHEAVIEVQVSHLKEDRLHAERVSTDRFTEILLQLKRIEDKVDRHTENGKHGDG